MRTRALFCDLLNLPRGKYLPADVAKDGSVGFARAAFAVSYDRDLLPVPGCGVHDGLPDSNSFSMKSVVCRGRMQQR